MHKLIINKLGPIERCELECSPFMTLTGFQASGKSTIAKAIYYFRTIKNDILNLAETQALLTAPIAGMDTDYDVIYGHNLKKGLEQHLTNKFKQTFGPLSGLSHEMFMEYFFTDTCTAKIAFIETEKSEALYELQITFSTDLIHFLHDKNKYFSHTPLGIPEDELRNFNTELRKFFADMYSVVYIPAGRSMITLLSQQLNYIYATMNDIQKRTLDYCTKDYLERILRIKSAFSEGLQGLISYYTDLNALKSPSVKQALKLIQSILMGTYHWSNGEDQIVLENGKYVKLNFASSSQQECVWILNLLFYHLLQQAPTLFIIEEPEAHLFPESQKYITELIALVSNSGHSVVLTTHSPYVLGTLNNLLCANTIPQKYSKKADDIIPKSFWLDDKKFDSWFVKGGGIENCMDAETHMIQNERIDEISKVINTEFDNLLALQNT